MPIEVREVTEASPVTMETISSSWVMEFCGNGGMLVLTGVKARGRGICMENTGHCLDCYWQSDTVLQGQQMVE